MTYMRLYLNLAPSRTNILCRLVDIVGNVIHLTFKIVAACLTHMVIEHATS
jgi:hypothetical protein